MTLSLDSDQKQSLDFILKQHGLEKFRDRIEMLITGSMRPCDILQLILEVNDAGARHIGSRVQDLLDKKGV